MTTNWSLYFIRIQSNLLLFRPIKKLGLEKVSLRQRKTGKEITLRRSASSLKGNSITQVFYVEQVLPYHIKRVE
jgi:hypothetical protein